MAAAEEPLEAGLSSVTDEEWKAAHMALIETGAFPPGELDFVWDPALDPATLIGPDEEEVAPDG